MPQHQARAPNIQASELFYPSIQDLQRLGIAELLARQQEEYDEYLVEKPANGMPRRYEVKVRAARQAARNAISSTGDDLRPRYPSWPTMWVAVAVAFSILLFLKLRYS
jgi:hypothetical protein